jgi:hypothetical protein
MDAVSFAKDIEPILRQFRGSMLWRLDLTSYEHVKANADKIYDLISTRQMPPPPYPHFTDAQVSAFKSWKDSGCLP